MVLESGCGTNSRCALTTDAVSQQKQEQVLATQQEAQAACDQAVADRNLAQLNRMHPASTPGGEIFR